MISQENKLIDMTGLNRFRIGDEVVADACADHDRFEGVVIGIELQRVYASRVLQPSITLLHDVDQITDGFSPDDLSKVDSAALSVQAEPVGYVTKNEFTKLRLGVSCVDLFGKVVPTGFEMVPLYAHPPGQVPDDPACASVGELNARIADLEGKLAEATDTLKFYANPDIYKPHPHGAAFDRRDLSFSARSTLSTLRSQP